MKKTLLLSVVASTMIMAGGDIAPVEPVVEAPVEVAAWDFSGQIVAYTQTTDGFGDGSLFDSDSTYAAWGAQLMATNADVFAGIGAGIEVSGIVSDEGDLRAPGFAGYYNGGGDAQTTSGGITQAYLTYGMDSINTSLKIGRQTLPKALSPFAFSEGWQMFKNTFDAALVVNSSLPSTTLVYAFVKNHNRSVGAALNESSFLKANDSDGIHMVTAQNKSISNLTLTGTWYFAGDYELNHGFAATGGDTNILWGDATYKADALTVGVQGGQISPDVLDSTSAWGAKLGYNFGMFDAMVAYTSVGDGVVGITNIGTATAGSIDGIKSPLYTQMVLNNVGQFHAAPDSDFLKVAAGMKALGGKFTLAYGDADSAGRDFTEFDLMYKTKVTEDITLFGAYVYTDGENAGTDYDSSNFLRFWARYNF